MRAAAALAAASLLLAALGLAAAVPTPLAVRADTVILNADVHTVDDHLRRVTAVAIRDGRILAVGSNLAIREYVGSKTRQIDAKGQTVLPGFVDSHIHLRSGSGLATGVDLSEILQKSEWLRLIAEKVATLPKGQWLLGGAWDHNLDDGILPDRTLLDAVAPEHPVLLRDIDAHSAWANSRAIELAGIRANSPVPPGGVILLDDAGEPNGIFLEGAMGLFNDAPGMREATDIQTGLEAAAQLANRYGITTVHDMSGVTEAFIALAREGDLSLRVWQGAFANPRLDTSANEQLVRLAAERQRIADTMAAIELPAHAGPLFELGFIKIAVDGVLSTRTAFMAEPYADAADEVGEPFMTENQLEQLVRASVAQAFPVAIHAIGDAAVAMVLDVYAKHPPQPDVPAHRVEHIEVVRPDAFKRFERLGVSASMQPHHATCCVGNYVIDRIGPERMPYAYPWQSFIKQEVPLLLSADWPTSPLNPLVQIADAMERKTSLDGELATWDSGQTLRFEDALLGYTRLGAEHTSWRDSIGSIAPGRWADLVLLDRRLDIRSPEAVRAATVQETLLGGTTVYRRP
ncbi:MAG: amidohydrolase [Pseudomonadota bacterium]